MAHTEVFITSDAEVLVPSIFTVTVADGDTVAFSTKGTVTAFAFFSPGASAALAPSPTGPVALSAESPTVFTFKTSQPGNYSVLFEKSAGAPAPKFPGGESNVLHVAIDSDGAHYGANVDHTKSG